MGFAEKSHQQIGCKQVMKGLLLRMFVAFQLTFVARHGRAQILVIGTRHNNVVSKNSLGPEKNLRVLVRCYQHLPSAEVFCRRQTFWAC